MCTLYNVYCTQMIGKLWRSNSQTDANAIWWLRKKMSQIEQNGGDWRGCEQK